MVLSESVDEGGESLIGGEELRGGNNDIESGSDERPDEYDR